MKACEEYIEKIVLSLDGELSEQEEKALEAHLGVCEGCRCLYRTYRNLDAGIQDMELEPPEGLVKSVMQEIRLEQEKTRPIYYIKRMKFSLVALAACLVLVVAGKFVSLPQEAAPDTPASQPETMAAEPETMEDTAWLPAHEEETAGEVMAETVMEDEMEIQGRSLTSEAMAHVLDALNRDGYRGDLVELFDMTEKEIYEKFPQAETLLISSGDRVYQISWEQFDAVEPEMNYGTVVSTDEVGDWVYLWIAK